MTPRDIFEAHYRSAEVLLRVYRLLESDEGPKRDDQMMPQLRQLLSCKDDEELILLMNQLFMGVVRENAEVTLSFFRKENLDLLLRQSVVAACSALDVFLPALLETYLPTVIQVRQRNFVPADGETRAFFTNFRLKLEDIWPLAEEESMDARWGMIARRVLDYCRGETLSNERGITATMSLLGIEKPWERVAAQVGEKERALRDKLKTVVNRRNSIIHRADRPATDPQGAATPIDYVWTQNHVGAVRIISLACYDLAREKVRDLTSVTSVTSAPSTSSVTVEAREVSANG